MFAEIVFVIIGIVYLINKDAKYRQKINECSDKGMFVHTNSELENGIFQDYCFEYQYKSKDRVPEKYREFFMFNGRAMYDYFMALAARDVWKQGYRPHLMSIMPKDGFDFLKGFHSKYDQKVEDFNRQITLFDSKKRTQ